MYIYIYIYISHYICTIYCYQIKVVFIPNTMKNTQLYATIMSRTSFKVNLHSIICLNVKVECSFTN